MVRTFESIRGIRYQKEITVKDFSWSIQAILKFFCLDRQFLIIILFMRSWSLQPYDSFLLLFCSKEEMSLHSMNLTILFFRIDLSFYILWEDM